MGRVVVYLTCTFARFNQSNRINLRSVCCDDGRYTGCVILYECIILLKDLLIRNDSFCKSFEEERQFALTYPVKLF